MKTANIIIIGGTIAAGKSTLVSNLSEYSGWKAVPELKEDDDMQDIILKKMYEGTRVHPATIQCYFIKNRMQQYIDHAEKKETSIIDRGVWEDWFFAKLWLKPYPKIYEAYVNLWKESMAYIIEKFGKPKAYIYVTVDWETFKERIFSRNRDSEIHNFSKNEEFFKELLKEYNRNFINLLEEWGIEPIVIDSLKFNKKETMEEALLQLKKRSIIE